MHRSPRLAATFTTLAGASALAGLVAVASLPADAAPPPQTSRSGVCAGVAACHRVADVDVTGDGKPDLVGWRQISPDAVQIRVLTAGGRLVTKRVDVRLWWGGGAWAGTGRVDGRAGVELLVGSEQGAHTPMYTMLTYRAGALVVEKSPSALSHLWQVDAAYGDDMGWWRRVLPDGRVEMTQKIAIRVEGGSAFTGHDVTYAWSTSGWSRVSRTSVRYPSPKAAAAISGFHVTGLKAFPGLT